jgi:phage recombination protein Bet
VSNLPSTQAMALAAVGSWTPEQVALIRETVAKGASEAEFKLFMAVCGRTGLDPFTRQIHFVKYGQTPGTTVTGIDGYRLIAQRSGEYQGQVGPSWCGPDGSWLDVWLAAEAPAAARVGVWRAGFKEPAWGVARMSAYKGSGPMWTKMGAEMLAKCAEALALRKAFPNELSGLYTREEMAQAQGPEDGASSAPAASTAPVSPASGSSAAVVEEKDWRTEFVGMAREAGYVGRGALLEAVNAVTVAMGAEPMKDTKALGPDDWHALVIQAIGDLPKRADRIEAVAEAAMSVEAANALAEDPEATGYYSHSEGKLVPIAWLATPHLEAAIQKLEAAINGLLPPDTMNAPEVLDALKAERERRKGNKAAWEQP